MPRLTNQPVVDRATDHGAAATSVNLASDRSLTLTPTCAPRLRSDQRVSMILGGLEFSAEPSWRHDEADSFSRASRPANTGCACASMAWTGPALIDYNAKRPFLRSTDRVSHERCRRTSHLGRGHISDCPPRSCPRLRGDSRATRSRTIRQARRVRHRRHFATGSDGTPGKPSISPRRAQRSAALPGMERTRELPRLGQANSGHGALRKPRRRVWRAAFGRADAGASAAPLAVIS